MFLQIEQAREVRRQLAVARWTEAIAAGTARPRLRYATPREPLPGAPLLDRGVYAAPFLTIRSEPILFAVDSTARCRGRVIIQGISTWDSAEQALWELLDVFDPAPRLELVRSA